MRFYQHKDFLTFDDVAEYLKDKGMFDLDISQECDYKRLEALLIEWVRFEKITPVFYNIDSVDVISYQYIDNKKIENEVKFTDNQANLYGYYGIDPTAYEYILHNEQVQTKLMDFYYDYVGDDNYDDYDYIPFVKNDNDNDNSVQRQYYNLDIGTMASIKYKPYKLLSDYTPKTVDDCQVYYQLFSIDGIGEIKKCELLYPKSQLEALFLQHQKGNLQQQIKTIDSQLDDKELSTRSQNTVGTIIAGLANLANIDLKSHYGDDSNKKIRQELLKLGFKANEKDGLPLSSETVAKWLKIADDLSK